MGDLVLKEVAGWRLRGLLRESDTVTRLGGDEFAIAFEFDRPAGSSRNTWDNG